MLHSVIVHPWTEGFAVENITLYRYTVGYFFRTMKQCLSFSLAFSKFPTLSQDIPHAAHTLVVSRLHLVEISIARLNRLSCSNWSLIRLKDKIYSNKANIQFAMSGYVHKIL